MKNKTKIINYTSPKKSKLVKSKTSWTSIVVIEVLAIIFEIVLLPFAMCSF